VSPVPEFMHYDDPPPPPWWRELLIEAAYRLAITAALAAVMYATAAYQGVL
jgi:hypothetical protein